MNKDTRLGIVAVECLVISLANMFAAEVTRRASV